MSKSISVPHAGGSADFPHKVGVITVLRKSDYVLVKTECSMEEVVVVVVVVEP